MQKTPKSTLLKETEKRIQTKNPGIVADVLIIEAMFFLHLFVDLPLTFGALAKFILQRICKQRGKEIHFVFDKTISPPIKDCERNKRGDNRMTKYQITGPEQKRPSKVLKRLSRNFSKL